jgi:predicted O-linked N-acetylglucosamine transferase (SPINDLY family)
MATLAEALAIALTHHQAGRLEMAEEIYRRILAVAPEQADAWHLLGVLAQQRGTPQTAAKHIRQAIALNPAVAEFHNNLGEACRAMGQTDEAVACYERALQLSPQMVDARCNLGVLLSGQGRRDAAMAQFRAVLEVQPDHAKSLCNLGTLLKDARQFDAARSYLRRAVQVAPQLAEAHNSLGVVCKEQGRFDEAVACYRRALELRPSFAAAHNNLGNVLFRQGRLGEAVACYQCAIQLKPDFAEAYSSLGNSLSELGRFEQAAVSLRQAVAICPHLAGVQSNLGNVLCRLGKLDEAAACHHRAIELQPDFADAHSNLGDVRKEQGRLDEAMACYRRALTLTPHAASIHSNLVYTLEFCPDLPRQTLAEELRGWRRVHAEPLAGQIAPHTNDRSPERRLRIGYVSPDFRAHAVGQFLLPLLESHDHRQFEVCCYSSVVAPDAVTARCRAAADVWREAAGLSDEQLAAMIRRDQVDLLVDLTMHMAGSRLLVFARKPAPLQITYLAYCSTTGLDAIDYRLTDPYLDPADADQSYYAEQSVRLPETYWCYRPLVAAAAVSGPPAARTGRMTFGCLNNFCKVTEPTLVAWSRLLQAIPRSRLLLHAQEGAHRDALRGRLAAQGIDRERIEFVPRLATDAYFQLYDQIDVALDPFPYGGGTTTLDALWMGVPVVTRVGQTAVGRGGLSILSNLGLAELAAHSTEQYLRIASELAHDQPRLAHLHATLRERMQGSPLMDARRFARNVEAAYRQMWRRWCGKHPENVQ